MSRTDVDLPMRTFIYILYIYIYILYGFLNKILTSQGSPLPGSKPGTGGFTMEHNIKINVG